MPRFAWSATRETINAEEIGLAKARTKAALGQGWISEEEAAAEADLLLKWLETAGGNTNAAGGQ
jgi:hypothetical protein